MSFKETALEIIREKIRGADWIREPLVGFADASSAHIRGIRSSVADDHLMPEDVLPEAEIIISYFLPFTRAAGECNRDGDFPSQLWADLYNKTNELIAEINEALVSALEEAGVKAAIPAGGFDTDRLLSRWSQRHVAEAAGLGTFGLNNMLITKSGSMGRFGSVVTSLKEHCDLPISEELCLSKAGGKCRACVKRCLTGALSEGGFNRELCYSVCKKAEEELGADVCGKCAVCVPCAVWD